MLNIESAFNVNFPHCPFVSLFCFLLRCSEFCTFCCFVVALLLLGLFYLLSTCFVLIKFDGPIYIFKKAQAWPYMSHFFL